MCDDLCVPLPEQGDLCVPLPEQGCVVIWVSLYLSRWYIYSGLQSSCNFQKSVFPLIFQVLNMRIFAFAGSLQTAAVCTVLVCSWVVTF